MIEKILFRLDEHFFSQIPINCSRTLPTYIFCCKFNYFSQLITFWWSIFQIFQEFIVPHEVFIVCVMILVIQYHFEHFIVPELIVIWLSNKNLLRLSTNWGYILSFYYFIHIYVSWIKFDFCQNNLKRKKNPTWMQHTYRY